MTIHSSGYRIEQSRLLRGDGFEWDHEIRVAVPPGYDESEERYPVLWLTDGIDSFDFALELLAEPGRVASARIIVGIGTPTDERPDLHRRRSYDFTPTPDRFGGGFADGVVRNEFAQLEVALEAEGFAASDRAGGAPAFLAFLVDVVRPALARDYRIGDENTLYGHSAGGLFVMYALFARPTAFARYVAGSPAVTFCDSEVLRMEERYAVDHDDLPATVRLGAGLGELLEGGVLSAVGIVSGTARIAELLHVRKYPSLALEVRMFPGATHGETPRPMLEWELFG